jgi:hypothetical protein
MVQEVCSFGSELNRLKLSVQPIKKVKSLLFLYHACQGPEKEKILINTFSKFCCFRTIGHFIWASFIEQKRKILTSVNSLRFVKFEASVSTVAQERMKEARKKDLPLVKMSQTLLTTRRLLYWSYQIGKRQTRSIYTILIKKEE